MKNAKEVTLNGEDLPRLARFSFDHADDLCKHEHGCNPYHKAWSYLRLFERGGALPAGEAFYSKELASVVARGGKRVLLSGAADTGLMALVVKVFAELGITPDITLVDLCGTVIEQNRQFVKSLKMEADFFVGDIRDFSAEPFDVIFAHSFMLFFPKNELSTLASTWRGLLKKDGIVLSTDYLTTSLEPVHISPITEDEIHERLTTVRIAAEARGLEQAFIAEICRCARLFFTEMHLASQTPLLTVAEMRNSMRMGGLGVVKTSLGASARVFSSYETQGTPHCSTVLGVLD